MAKKKLDKGETLRIKCPECGHVQEHEDTDLEAGTYIINCNNDDDKHCMGSVEATPKSNGKGWKFKKIKTNGKKENWDN
jgi:phage FluMu protein Com|tara:strand:+ start:90 stop:326 length:237 start_codon:yes stop_codon:yes gene_type:complete